MLLLHPVHVVLREYLVRTFNVGAQSVGLSAENQDERSKRNLPEDELQLSVCAHDRIALSAKESGHVCHT